jgi:dienelactone hydrolase
VKVKTFLAIAKLFLIVPLLGVIATTGCATYAPAAAERYAYEAAEATETVSTNLWPTRVVERLSDIVDIGPEIMSLRVRFDRLVGSGLVKDPKHIPAKDRQHSYLAGRGVIRTYLPPTLGSDRIMSMGMCFFSGVEGVLPPGPKKKNMLVRGTDEETERKWLVNLRGTWMRLDSPTGGFARGLVVHLTSFGGYQYERPVLEELRRRGWAVLWVDSSTVKPETSKVEVSNDDPGIAARRIAANIDDRVAEIAYAVEGAVDFIQQQRPDIPANPVVITGYSAGSLATPTVAKLLGERVQAAVLVGSGCNLLDISQRSTLTDGGLKLVWTRTPTAQDRERLMQEYLKASRLDPYWTSASLRNRPVLMLHATLDKIVPADTGDLLYARLGRPERLNFMLGHELLFFRLPSHADVIANWVDEAVAKRAAAAGGLRGQMASRGR